jgi:hypothetical protein
MSCNKLSNVLESEADILSRIWFYYESNFNLDAYVNKQNPVRFEVSTVVTMMIIIFWEMTPCGSYKNRRFGGSYRLRDSYEFVPIQELTISLCNQLALVHPEDGGDTIL